MELSNLSPLEQAEAREREATIAFDRSVSAITKLADDVVRKLQNAISDIDSAYNGAIYAVGSAQRAGAALDEIDQLCVNRLVHLENTILSCISAIISTTPIADTATLTVSLLTKQTELQQARIAAAFERANAPAPKATPTNDDELSSVVFADNTKLRCPICEALYGNYHKLSCIFAGNVVR